MWGEGKEGKISSAKEDASSVVNSHGAKAMLLFLGSSCSNTAVPHGGGARTLFIYAEASAEQQDTVMLCAGCAQEEWWDELY